MATGGRAQEPEVRPDTTVADTLAAAGRQEAPAPEEDRIQRFPDRLGGPEGFAAPVYECDRQCLLASPAFSLAEILVGRVPGIQTVRSGWLGGPHHLMNGGVGPGFVTVLVDGRPLSSLEDGQVDLRRISLVHLERVRVVRRAGELIVDVETLRRDRRSAYSRITAGTGSPDLQLMRGTFDNGLGRNFTVAGSFDLLDATHGQGIENDRFDFWGRFSWMPGTNDAGIELEYANEDLLRTGADSVEFDRRRVMARARANPTPAIQLEARGGQQRWRVATPEDAADGDGEEDVQEQVVEEVALVLRGRSDRLGGEAEVRLPSGPGHPDLVLAGRVGGRATSWLSVDAAGELASWEGFETREVRAGLSLTPVPWVTLRADGATGRRGVPRPVEGTADTVSYDVGAAGAWVRAGPWSLRGRVSLQRLDRVLPFGAAFDRRLAPGGEAEIVGWEAGLSGPILPIGRVIPGLAPIRVDGWFRHQETEEATVPFVPANLAAGEISLHDDFFEGNLEIWLSTSFQWKGEMASLQGRAEPQLVTLTSSTLWEGHVSFRIGDFRFFWRMVNPAGYDVVEVVDVPFPKQVNVVEVKWEFFN